MSNSLINADNQALKLPITLINTESISGIPIDTSSLKIFNFPTSYNTTGIKYTRLLPILNC